MGCGCNKRTVAQQTVPRTPTVPLTPTVEPSPTEVVMVERHISPTEAKTPYKRRIPHLTPLTIVEAKTPYKNIIDVVQKLCGPHKALFTNTLNESIRIVYRAGALTKTQEIYPGQTFCAPPITTDRLVIVPNGPNIEATLSSIGVLDDHWVLVISNIDIEGLIYPKVPQASEIFIEQIFQGLTLAASLSQFRYVCIAYEALYPKSYFQYADFPEPVLTNTNCKVLFDNKYSKHEPSYPIFSSIFKFQYLLSAVYTSMTQYYSCIPPVYKNLNIMNSKKWECQDSILVRGTNHYGEISIEDNYWGLAATVSKQLNI